MLSEKSILITGSTSGIGYASADLALKSGAKVFLHGRREAVGNAALDKLSQLYGDEKLGLLVGDLADPAFPQTLMVAAEKRFGRIHGLYHNAGISPRDTLDSLTPERFDHTVAINMRAPVLMIQAYVQHLRKFDQGTSPSSGGAVVISGSINAYCGQPDLLVYSMTRGAQMTMTRNLADALGHEFIRVNQLNIGWTMTENEMQIQLDQGQSTDFESEIPRSLSPRQKILRPEEVAQHAIFWLSDLSAPTTGSIYEIEQFPLIGRNRLGHE